MAKPRCIVPDKTERSDGPVLIAQRGSDDPTVEFKLGTRETGWHSHVRGQLIWIESGLLNIRTAEGSWMLPPQRAGWAPPGVAGPAVTATQGVAFVNASDGQLKLTSAWGIRGAFNHNWDPYWSTSLFGSYSAVRYGGTNNDLNTAKGQYCAAFALSHAGNGITYNCNPDYNVAQLGVVTRWTPVKNLTFSGEVQWFHLDQKMSGIGGAAATSVFSPGAPKPSTVYEFKDQNTVLLQIRAQRNF